MRKLWRHLCCSIMHTCSLNDNMNIKNVKKKLYIENYCGKYVTFSEKSSLQEGSHAHFLCSGGQTMDFINMLLF